MGTSWHRVLLVLWFLQLTLGGGLAADQLCGRLMLTGLREDHTAFYMYAGIYEVQDYLHDGFPVLKKSNLFFSYDEPKNRFVIGFAVGKMYGLAATIQHTLNSKTWLQEARSDEPFSRVLKRWYEASANSTRYIDGSIRFKCIDEEYQSCDSGKMEFDTVLVQNPGQPNESVLNIPGRFYYEVIPHLYHNNRPVYELKNHSLANDMKLYYDYDSNGWVAGPHFPMHSVSMVAEDHALSPEQIVSDWKYDRNGTMVSTYAKLRCLTSQFGKSCENSVTSCQNGGTCYHKPSGGTICLCETDFYGVTCEKMRPKCPFPNSDVNNPGPGYCNVLNIGNVMGSVGTVFCHKGYEQQYFPIVCAAKADQSAVGEWKGLKQCSIVMNIARKRLKRQSYTLKPYTRPTFKPYDYPTFQPYSDIWPIITVVGPIVFLQLFLPSIIYCILSCISCCLDKKQNGNLSEEEIERIEERRRVKNISCIRVFSLIYYICFWLWIPLVIFVSVVDTQIEVLKILRWCGVAFSSLSYLWVLIESCCSREYKYLKVLSKVEDAAVYLKELRETTPHLVMHAECYHFVTRTRTVQNRTETYQQKVVTHVDSEMFQYGFWIDTSDSHFAFSHKYGVTKIKLQKTILPGDEDTAEKLREAENAFRMKNQHFDVHMNYHLNLIVDGFKKRLAAYSNPKHRSCWISSGCFWVSTVLLMSWPYRWIFRARTGNAKYKVEKRIFMTPPEQTEYPSRDYTAYNVTQEQQSRMYQEAPGAADAGTDEEDKRKSRKAKGKKLKTDVDLELGEVPLQRY